MKRVLVLTAALVLTSTWSAVPAGASQHSAKAPAPRVAGSTNANWTTYHYDNTRAGYDPNEPSVSTLASAWTQSAIVGQVYAEPLIYGGSVYIVTQANWLYALDANNNGAVQWSMQLSTPMASSGLPCGNVSPNVGITGTPVIDAALNRIFMVGMVSTQHYVLWGVDLTTHAIVVNATVDPGDNTAVLHDGQRGALALSQGVVYIPFGGRFGDCQPYHGIVLGAHDTDGSVLYSFTTNGFGSGIWAPGGESVDASGNVYVATGNGDPPDSESVFVLNPNLTVKYHWIPSDQASLDSTDTDVGSISPGLVGGGDVVQGGKSGEVALLDSTLGQLQYTKIASCEQRGATAYLAPYIYMPCEAGLYALNQSGNSFSVAWNTTFNAGPPIVAGGVVFTIGIGTGTLYALNPVTGAQITSAATGSVNGFATPATGDGLVVVGGLNTIFAFKMGGCTSAFMSPSVASPQAPGTTVTFTASAVGCASPEFKFFVQSPGGSWVAQGGGFGANTFAWNTATLANGVYGVGVWARQTGSSAAYETYWLGTYTLTVTTCNAATVSTVTASPQAPGTSINFTATAARCPGAQFRFWLQPHGGAWTMQQDYGAGSWTWNTATSSAPGTYEIGVWALQPGSTASYDAYGFTSFVLGSGTCNTAGLSPGVAPPQVPTTMVTFTATSNGCTNPLYQFWLLRPGYTTWSLRQPYSASTTWTWDTTTWPLGTYQVGVWAKASASANSYDAYFIGTFQLDVGPCTAAGITASPASPQAAGASITFTASSTGCSAANYQFWELPPPGTNWAIVQPYGTGTTFTWNSTGASGPYRFGVWARQAGSPTSYDSYAIVTFWVS